MCCVEKLPTLQNLTQLHIITAACRLHYLQSIDSLCVCSAHKCLPMWAHTYTIYTEQTRFRKSIWDQETNYLNDFPFRSLSLTSSCFPTFYFSCVYVYFLWISRQKKNDSTSLGKKMPHFPLKPVAKIPCPRERWQMTNDGATRLLLYSAWKTKRNGG